MGMFDTIIIEKKDLPTTPENIDIILNGGDWQTKHFDCLLDELWMKEDGKVYKDGKELPMGNDSFYFCHIIDDVFYDFEAQYKDGELISIELVEKNNLR